MKKLLALLLLSVACDLTPVPSPSPSPSATPGCTLEIVESRLRVNVVKRNSVDGPLLDATFEYRYHTLATPNLGPCGRVWCPLGVDGPGPACDDALVGTPQWVVISGSGAPRSDNPYVLMLASEHGLAEVYSERFPNVFAVKSW